MNLVDRVRAAVFAAFQAAALELGSPAPGADNGWVVERPKRPEHGDLATNIAMTTAKLLGRPARVVAEAVARALAGSEVVASAEVAGPGFINLRLHPRIFQQVVFDVLGASAAPPSTGVSEVPRTNGWGHAPAATRERIDIEFVSANPTGPVTVASGRNAVLGDAVARLLEATGHRVTREYYINDRGNQVRAFADSVRSAAQGREPPADGYRGAYVAELATWLDGVDREALRGNDLDALGRICVSWMLRGVPGSRTLPGIRPSLADLRVHFDVWFSEESLYRWGAVQAVMRKLEEGGFLVRKDGALFFKAPEGAIEDKDRVLQKSNGEWAYFASDVAYFADKIERGYDRLINVLGADHHGYVARVRNALKALGLPEDRFEALLYQLVFITQGGEAVKSSKRAGNVVTIDEIMDEIDEAAARRGAGADALRFFFLSRSASSNVDFDIDLAKRSSLDNPVFYVQYGYARLCSIQRKAHSLGLAATPSTADFRRLVHPDELSMCHLLADFPGVVEEAARQREPHRIVFYVQELARRFQSYFTRLKVEQDPILPSATVRSRPGWESSWDFDKTRARLLWIQAIRMTYSQALDLVGVSAPDRMIRPPSDVEAEDPVAGEEAD
ncbi:MAG TPA: arginine--tRNA ligase [Polyangiaceae bacterium]|nr:arginine--tRNA ligase [Polyangiaceae bacterium]